MFVKFLMARNVVLGGHSFLLLVFPSNTGPEDAERIETGGNRKDLKDPRSEDLSQNTELVVRTYCLLLFSVYER